MPTDISPLWISFKIATLATLITFFLGISAAYWMLDYRGRWRSLIEAIFISPLIMPPTVVGFLLLILLGRNGFLGQLLHLVNINIVFTWYGAAITATVVAFPLMYKTTLAAFEQIDTNLQKAARTLGANEITVFWRITFPLALPGILAGATLAFARALGEFGATLMLAGNIPGQTQTIPMAIYFAVESGETNEAWAWSIIILTISLSAIGIVNFWQESKRNRVKKNLQIKPIIEKQKKELVNQTGLFVDIYKQLANFQLDVSFSNSNSPLGLLGASGSGKSFILRCIAGIETPTSGQIVLNNRVLFDSAQGINLPVRDRRVGFLFQNYALFPHLTVAENIAFGLPKNTPPAIAQSQITAQLAAVQMQEFAYQYPSQLSGGQQQRVALARVLVSNPEILLLDEPFSALDTHLRYQLEKQIIATLQTFSGVTIFVTHNLEEAYRVCDRLLVLEQGKIIAAGNKQEIFEHPNTVRVAQLTGCKNFSRTIIKTAEEIEAIDWQCQLRVIESIPETLSHVGIRAHQLIFPNIVQAENTFPCWLAHQSETPHRMTLYLKLNSAPINPQDYHLQAEVFKENWKSFKDRPFPWLVHLDPLRLLLLSD